MGIYTGFNQKSHSKSIIKTYDNYHIKKSGGGINYLFHRSFYPVVSKALIYCITNNKKWWERHPC